jgi:hypothetical protein
MARLFGRCLTDVAIDLALNADERTMRARFVATCFRATEKFPPVADRRLSDVFL